MLKNAKKKALSVGLAAALMVPAFAMPASAGYGTVYNTEKKPSSVLSQLKQQKEIYSKDTLVIKYSKKLTEADHRKAGTTLVKSYPSLGYDVVKLQKGSKLPDVMARYKSANKVLNISPSAIISSFAAKKDPKAKDMYHLSQLGIDKAQKLAGDKEVIVAVIDTWVDADHPELKNQVLPPYNIANPASPGSKDTHGTHVSGIIAGEKGNGIGGYGINPNAKILPINVFDGYNAGSDYVIAEAILYAVDHGAKVINMSLGGYGESKIMEEAVEKAISAGVTVVAAAGNESTDEYPTPASYEGVISVGSTNSKYQLSSYSNYGPQVDVVAPGEAVYSSTYYPSRNQSSFTEMDGTSMASPVVAGVASLILSKYPDLKPYQVEALIETTARDLGKPGYDLTFANGLVDPAAALSYDISKLPKAEKLTDEQLAEQAKEQSFGEGEVKASGKITKPMQQDAYKAAVAAGVPVQIILDGADNYDYKAEVLFFDKDGKKAGETTVLNQSRAGEAEGYVYVPEEDGTIVVAVSDSNDSYSKSGDSQYTLRMFQQEVPEDESSKESMLELGAFPVKQQGYLFSSEDGDKDYYSFKVNEPAKIEAKLSGLPGVDTSLNVYLKDDLMMELPEGVPASEAYMYEPYPIDMANMNGPGGDETLVFEAMPEMEYVLEVASGTDAFFDPYYYMMMGGYSLESQNTNSLVPYTLTADVKVLPEDEDLYPEILSPEEMLMEEEITMEEYKAKKKDALAEVIVIMDEFRYFPVEEVEKITAAARQLEEGSSQSGYFQMYEDQDWFSFTTGSNAVYELSTNMTNTLMPSIELFEYDAETKNLVPVAGSYYGYAMDGSMEKADLTVSLKPEKQYYVMLSNNYRLSMDEYKLNLKKVMEAPVDENEPNDKASEAKNLKVGGKATGNLASMNDADYFYYKNLGKDQFVNVTITPNEMSLNDQLRLPGEFTQQIVPLVEIYEDTNNNKELDAAEQGKVIAYLRYDELMNSVWIGDLPLTATFKAKEGLSYFINVIDLMGMGLSFTSYDIELTSSSKMKDEDAGSTVKNNIPSKPVVLKQNGKTSSAKGYLNIGVPFGDKDHYSFEAAKAGSYQFQLDLPSQLDGVLSVYSSKGVLVKEINYYGYGDSELESISLEKGKYYIEVKDAAGQSSDKPYQLTVTQP
ncbi:peptidase S8 [Bacillus infantis]|uniref:S8 family serine peptidase n=1 Tax=Bacillus infantis TaxID=324767 RepID=UPI00101CD0CE|nr:S8 family serine peptidase [Bacillus infantis]RYI28847.1 peptidase S8 [Bacillus infantis]